LLQGAESGRILRPVGLLPDKAEWLYTGCSGRYSASCWEITIALKMRNTVAGLVICYCLQLSPVSVQFLMEDPGREVREATVRDPLAGCHEIATGDFQEVTEQFIEVKSI